MKAYVQYFTDNLAGKTVEALASDGYRPLDARLSVFNMIAAAEKPNFKNYTRFEIRRGDFKKYRVLYKNFKNESEG
jgi:hypothetical protein